MILSPFVYDALPGRVVFGLGAGRERLVEELTRLGARRVLAIVAEPERGLAETLLAGRRAPVVGTFAEVRPHVPVEVARAARHAARHVAADALLCIGGGSTTGTAKAVALETGLPIVAVPTTYAGSEMTPIWGLTEGRRKTTGTSRSVLPAVVVYDPELTVSLPAGVTGPSAINALAHCVEAFYAPGANPVTALVAEEGIRALAAGVPGAVADPGDLDARTATLYGAYLAGAALAAAGTGLHHKICHVLGGAYDLPHADLHTVILPHAVAFNAPATAQVMVRVARALGARDAAAGLFDLASRIGAPTALRDIGLREGQLDEAAALVLAKVPADNPRAVDEVALRRLLDDAWAGRRPSAHALAGADGGGLR